MAPEHQEIQGTAVLSIMNKYDPQQLPPQTTSDTHITTQVQLAEPQEARNKGTPPPTLQITNEEALQEKTSGESKARTVKRALFPEQPSNSKKQKAPAEPTTEEKGMTRATEKKQQN